MDLGKYRFKINPYDQCVVKKTVNGHQMKIIWHVDDIKLSQKDTFEITKFVHYLSQIYGEKLTINKGKIHNYLGMDMNFFVKA